MTSDRLKKLARIRLVLSGIALLLAGLMIVSGVQCFGARRTSSSAPEPVETTVEIDETMDVEFVDTKIESAAEETAVGASRQPAADQEKPRETEGAPNMEDEFEDEGAVTEGTDGTETEVAPEVTPEVIPEGTADVTPEVIPEGTADVTPEVIPEGTADATPEVIPEGTQNSFSAQSTAQSSETLSIPDTTSTSTTAVVEETVPSETLPAESLVTVPSTVIQTEPETTGYVSNEKEDMDASQTEQQETNDRLWGLLFWLSAGLLSADLLAILLISTQIEAEKKRLKRIRKSLSDTDAHARRSGQTVSSNRKDAASNRVSRKVSATQITKMAPYVGKIHQIGRREYQQDSLGHAAVLNNQGYLAVVADGMGGLSSGEKVSQKIVMDALTLGHQLNADHVNGVLWKMLDNINENVNNMLGSEGLYKSGSTMVAVLIYGGKFQWIAVGDSRIYLYRSGYANQLNHDHDQLQVWMADVLSGRRTMEDVLQNPDSRKLTSFIGMGQLKYVDGSRSPIALETGDRLVLMSDGIYNIVNEDQLADILNRYPDVQQATSAIERAVYDGNHPRQDNFTAIVLGF